MALEVYFRDDIERVVTSLALMAAQTCMQQGAYGTESITGVLTMARSMALSFGCDWGRILATIRSEGYGWLLATIRSEGYGWLLDQADIAGKGR